jgi:hypothetical protein
MSHENKNKHITLAISEQSKYLNKNIENARSRKKTPSMTSQKGMDELAGHWLMLLRPTITLPRGKRMKKHTNTLANIKWYSRWRTEMEEKIGKLIKRNWNILEICYFSY